MEAATPLRAPHVRVVGDRVAIDGLVVDDECAVRLVKEREQNGEDAIKLVRDAVEIGARVLDREQAGANAEFVKTEFERAAAQLNSEFTDKARAVAEFLGERVDSVFGPENGQLAKDLDKLFSDGSSASVQNRVRELVAETMARSREDLIKQFSAADGSNPLADFKAGTIRVLKAAEERQHESQQALLRQMAELEKQLQALHLEKEKLEAVEAEREKGSSAKGRSFEEQVAVAIDRIALGQGDVAEAVGDFKEGTGKVGDVVVAIDAAHGPARGRIVVEAKDKRLSKPRAIAELDEALAHRSADVALLVVPTEEELPAKVEPLREYNGDKVVVALDPEWGTLPLELAYRLARARVLMKRSDADGIDAGALRDTLERALATLAEERKVKQQLTGAKTSIDKAYEIVEAMAARVRCHLDEMDAVLRQAVEGAQLELDG
jgi:flagellar hook-basal body complex protein FliE